MPLWLQVLLFDLAFAGVAYTAYRRFSEARLAVLLMLGVGALAVLLILEGAGSDAAAWAAFSVACLIVTGLAGLWLHDFRRRS